jgi:hypothetical protein
LFATHYHELCALSDSKKSVANFNVAVREWNDDIIFLRKILPGQADKSYGIQVAPWLNLKSIPIQNCRITPEPPSLKRWRIDLTPKAGGRFVKKRKETVEPVFGIIKEVLGFRRFMLRGMEKVGLESDQLKSSYNLKKMDHLGMRFSAS